MSDGIIDLTDALEMLSKCVLGVLEVNPVILFSNFDGLVPFSTGLVELAEKIVSTTLTI